MTHIISRVKSVLASTTEDQAWENDLYTTDVGPHAPTVKTPPKEDPVRPDSLAVDYNRVKTRDVKTAAIAVWSDEESPEVKKMDLQEFVDFGFLQEANRQFFHPLGLALEVETDDAGKPIRLSGVWDYREDPEGVLFGSDMIDQGKVDSVESLRIDKLDTRSLLSECSDWGYQKAPAEHEEGLDKTAAICTDLKSLPKVGDTVTEVELAEDLVADIRFNSGASVAVHVWRDEESSRIFPTEEDSGVAEFEGTVNPEDVEHLADADNGIKQ